MAERFYVRLNGDAAPGPETTAPRDTPIPAALLPCASSILHYREQLGDTEVVERVVPVSAGCSSYFLSTWVGRPVRMDGSCARLAQKMGYYVAPYY